MGTRVIGVEVVCGPIDEVFLYLVDDLVGGGANFMIEVLRRALKDLSVRLQGLQAQLPKGLLLQFDNCGENKNKEMFFYLSLLVQEGLVDEIKCNFLVVGHTHCSIDQYFGTISKLVFACKFIASPVSLVHLLKTIGTESEELRLLYSHDKKKASTAKTPSIVDYIHYVYDYRSCFKPYMNQIKYVRFPHNFR